MFEGTLAPSARRGTARRRFEVLPLALGVHGLALGVFVAGQLWAVSELPEPYTVVGFYTPPLPPPLGRASGRPRANPRPRSQADAPREIQPAAIPTETASARPPQPGAGDDRDGVPGATDDGQPSGLPGGVPGAQPPLPAAEPDRIYKLDLVSTSPVPVYRPAPVYPEVARRLHREGTAIVEAVIDRRGRVVDVHILRDPGLGLGEAAVEAILAWRYEPATLDGRPVAVWLTVTVTFKLGGEV
jgi:protein TonB